LVHTTFTSVAFNTAAGSAFAFDVELVCVCVRALDPPPHPAAPRTAHAKITEQHANRRDGAAVRSEHTRVV
jgi:hypothetical protein